MVGLTEPSKDAMIRRPIGIDLFSGAGGLSLGFEQAGFDVVAAVEIDPIHAAIHKFNFPECTVIPRSVIGLSGRDIRRLANIDDRAVEVVFGGAPCQGFSLIGQRVLDDPRNALVREFVRIVQELSASYFVFENVKGLTVGKHKRFLDELIRAFRVVGYQVQLPWRVLNACSYGVPQDRQRLFLLGAKEGLPLPDYPDATTRPAGSKTCLFDLQEGPSCRDALGDLPDVERFSQLFESDSVITDKWGDPSDYARGLRCDQSGAWHYGYKRRWQPNLLTSSMRTSHTEISRRRFAETDPGCIEPISRFFKLTGNGISNTLRAGTDSARGAFTSPRPIHYKYARCISVREMARLHGFPDWFRLHETKWHGARQIGNAVAPPVGRAIAVEICKILGVKLTKPTRILDLGDPALLQMGMSQAAEYWGIPVSIGRRDRRSGIKKRRQEEIEAIRLAAVGG
jgi:DNA (cytosine-5)-methyltransferase 1